MVFEGYHGTDFDKQQSIFDMNFSVSASEDDWLGTGAYFFIDGISDPIQDAKHWAKLHAYDKIKKSNRYNKYAVIKAIINVTNVLRLDQQDGMIAYNVFRNYLLDRMKKERIRPKVGAIRNDCEVCNHILQNSDFDAIVNFEYIKLDKWTRVKNYSSRIPTCRIMSVKEPKISINVDGLSVVDRGDV